ncbi:hypothetical protein EV121DRAFT_298076 [Schizophyllum commune]
MPSFVYKNYITDTADPAMGAFRGELLVTFLKHLFRGPEAAKSGKPPKPGKSAARQAITAEMVAYAVLVLRHALSSDKDWRMDSDGVAKAVVWRSCLQVFYPDLTMDLGVEEYEEGSDSGEDDEGDDLPEDAKAASIMEKKIWAREVLEELTERVYGVQHTRTKRVSTTRPKRPSTAIQISRNFAKKHMQAQSAMSRPSQEPAQEVPPGESRSPQPDAQRSDPSASAVQPRHERLPSISPTGTQSPQRSPIVQASQHRSPSQHNSSSRPTSSTTTSGMRRPIHIESRSLGRERTASPRPSVPNASSTQLDEHEVDLRSRADPAPAPFGNKRRPPQSDGFESELSDAPNSPLPAKKKQRKAHRKAAGEQPTRVSLRHK